MQRETGAVPPAPFLCCQVGSICLDLVEWELRRHAHWREELERGEEGEGDGGRSRRKFSGLVRRQDQLLRVCLYLLLNVAEEPRSEIKMVNRGLVPMLVECLGREQPDLLLLAVCFLKRLSVYYENQVRGRQLLLFFPNHQIYAALKTGAAVDVVRAPYVPRDLYGQFGCTFSPTCSLFHKKCALKSANSLAPAVSPICGITCDDARPSL
ncbi:hypothetical protein HPB48_005940 [Haemaphysalis longicornis]|uniref:Uncharacterized protein n=1 Tax=Haemaphysalis longicornis TaxID=44386 RepID=A0A9J6FL45_HAELO|nr:hypothetical protein HPB48_005940 [Haemaphysalis longicornis]